jgi:hypothetical protein
MSYFSAEFAVGYLSFVFHLYIVPARQLPHYGGEAGAGKAEQAILPGHYLLNVGQVVSGEWRVGRYYSLLTRFQDNCQLVNLCRFTFADCRFTTYNPHRSFQQRHSHIGFVVIGVDIEMGSKNLHLARPAAT